MRATWDRRRALAVALGGALGATVRWAVVSTVDFGTFPWPVLLINVAGSLLLGGVLAGEWSHPSAHVVLHDGAAIGFCGGLTTFSTFALEVVELTRDGLVATAVVYGVASVGATAAAVSAGAAALRRLRAVAMPLEAEP
jgi:fluoride exporter